jgi:hypothetical protein
VWVIALTMVSQSSRWIPCPPFRAGAVARRVSLFPLAHAEVLAAGVSMVVADQREFPQRSLARRRRSPAVGSLESAGSRARYGLKDELCDLVGLLVEREVSRVGDLDEPDSGGRLEQRSLVRGDADVVPFAEHDPGLCPRVAEPLGERAVPVEIGEVLVGLVAEESGLVFLVSSFVRTSRRAGGRPLFIAGPMTFSMSE